MFSIFQKEINEIHYKFIFLKWKIRYKGVKLTKKLPEEKREDELRDALINILNKMKHVKTDNIQKLSLLELIHLAEKSGFSY